LFCNNKFKIILNYLEQSSPIPEQPSPIKGEGYSGKDEDCSKKLRIILRLGRGIYNRKQQSFFCSHDSGGIVNLYLINIT
jgi:hypothetical protein